MGILDSLFVRLGYDVDQETIDEYNASVEETSRLMKKVVLGAIGAATALAYLTKKTADATAKTMNQANVLDVAFLKLGAIERAAEDLAIDPAKFTGALGEIVKLKDALKTGIGVDEQFLLFLSQLGIGIEEIQNLKTDEALEKIVSSFNKLDDESKRGIAHLSPFRDLLLELAGRDIGKAFKDNEFTFDPQPILEFRKLWVDTIQAITNGFNHMSSKVLPLFNKVINAISLPENLAATIKDITSIVTGDFSPLKEGLTKQQNLLGESSAGQSMFKALFEAENFITDLFGTKTPGNFALEGTSAAGSGGSSMVTNNYNMDSNFNVTSDDPNAASQAIVRELERMLKNTSEALAHTRNE